MEEARALYRNFFACIRAVLKAGQDPNVAKRRFAVLGVLWPSKKFADRALIAGGAASADAAADAILSQYLDTLKGGFDNADVDAKLEEAKRLLSRLEDEPQAREQFVALIRSLLPPTEIQKDVDASENFFTLSDKDLMKTMNHPVQPRPAGDAEASEGHLLDVESVYQFEARKLYNLNADTFIKGHSDICNNQVANAVLRAVAIT